VLNSNEVIVDLPRYEGLYKVSSMGYITNGRKTLKTYTINSGYLCLKLHDANGDRTSHLLHRLIAQAFIPNPHNLPQVNHINGNKSDCTVENLEWMTALDNRHHAADAGLWTYNKPTIGLKLGTSSQYHNVCWDKNRGKWLSSVYVDGKAVGQKRFEHEIDAAKHSDSIIKSFGLQDRTLNFI
jgi:hypothetical protein